MAEFSQGLIKKLPKTDLHVHLDGSIRLSTLIELAQAAKIDLPSYTEEGLRELVFKNHYHNLDEYLKGFALTLKVLHSPENLERCAYEFGLDCIADGIWYSEIRFAPQLHTLPDKMSMADVFQAIDKGLARASKEQNARHQAAPQEEAPYYYGLIACVMRFFKSSYSPYFEAFLKNESTAREKDLHDAALELTRQVIAIRDETAIPIVALDLAGAEKDSFTTPFKDAFAYAQDHFLFATIHAGEDEGAQSIYNAVTELHATRIGHALHLFDSSKLNLPTVKHKEIFLERLASFMAKKGIIIESCISSNLQTSPQYTLKTHVTKELLSRGMPFTLCTDNRLISNTTLCKEYQLLLSTNDLDAKQVATIVMNGFRGSFFPGTYQEKVAFVISAKEKAEKLLLKFDK